MTHSSRVQGKGNRGLTATGHVCDLPCYCISHSLSFLLPMAGPDNSSDTESAPSPSQTDPSKAGGMASQRDEDSAGMAAVAAASEQDTASDGKGQDAPMEELRVKLEKSPEEAGGDAGSQEDRGRGGYEAQVHTKTEPLDMEMSVGAGDVQVKVEPEAKERMEKHGEPGGQRDQQHSDNDSSATCSADEDVETEPRWVLTGGSGQARAH